MQDEMSNLRPPSRLVVSLLFLSRWSHRPRSGNTFPYCAFGRGCAGLRILGFRPSVARLAGQRSEPFTISGTHPD